MRLGILLFISGFICGVSLSYAGAAAAKNAGRAEVVADELNGKVTIFIDGKAVALFDANGFHVEGDINYSGALTDRPLTEQRHAP